MNGQSIASQLSYTGDVRVLKDYQKTGDIIKGIMDAHKIHAPEYDKISNNFWKGNASSTYRALFDFCKKNIRYDVEPDEVQTVKSPGAILHNGYGDCKHYSSFINGVIDSLKRKGYPVSGSYRFASYDLSRKDPHHVFVVAGNGEWIDPVLSSYNNRKMYYSATDRTPRISGIGTLYSISGFDNIGDFDAMGDDIGRRSKAERKARHEQRKAEGKGVFRKVAKGAKKVGLAPSRKMFLLMLRLNLFHKASNIWGRISTNPAAKQKLYNGWKKLGGQPDALEKAIKAGVKVWNKHHQGKQLAISGIYDQDVHINGLNDWGWHSSFAGIHLPGIGNFAFDGRAVGFAPAAVLAAALPIIKALAPILKSIGVKGGEKENEKLDEAEAPEENTEAPEGDTGMEYMPTEESQYDDPAEYEEDTGDVSGFDNIGSGRPLIRLRKLKPGEKPAAINFRSKMPVTLSPGLNLPVGPTSHRLLTPKSKIKNKSVQFVYAPGSRAVMPLKKPALLRPAVVRPDTGGGAMVYQEGITPTPAVPSDGAGISDMLNSGVQWVMENKTTVGIAAGGLLLFKYLSNRPKRRR